MTTVSDESSQPLYTRFLRLAGINILSNIMIPLASLVDTAFLGHLSDIRHLAGVALASVIFNVVYYMFTFLRMGTTGPTAQAEGRNDPSGVVLILLRNGTIALLLGGLILMLQYPLGELGLAILGPSSAVKVTAVDYFSTRIWGAPAVLLNWVLIGWFLGREQSQKVLLLSLLGNGANIVLDYWLIVQLDWASAGAGIATAASQYILLLCALLLIARELLQDNWTSQVSLSLPQLFEWESMQSLLILNSNIWLHMFIGIVTFSLFTEISATFGTAILAVSILLFQVIILVYYCTEGIGFSTERLSGLFQGQGTTQNFGPLLRISLLTCVALGGSIGLLFELFPESLFSLLTNHLEVIEILKHYLLWLLPALLLISLASMLDGYFLGLADGAKLRNAALLGCLLGFMPLTFTAYLLHDSHILWLAFCVFLALRVIALSTQVPATLTQDES